jgi:hypothetical protein
LYTIEELKWFLASINKILFLVIMYWKPKTTMELIVVYGPMRRIAVKFSWRK